MDKTTVKIREILSCIPDSRDKMSDAVNNDDPLLELGIIDSFGLIDFIGELEDAFAITIDPEELDKENFGTIARISELVSRKNSANI